MNRPPKVDLDAFHADLDTLQLAFVREHYDEFVTTAAKQQWDHLSNSRYLEDSRGIRGLGG